MSQMRSGTGNYGFDAATGQFVDLMAAGIIDPTRVVRLALENAVSVAGILLMTEATMTDVPTPRDNSDTSRGTSPRSGIDKARRPPCVCTWESIPGALPLALVTMAVGQMDCSSCSVAK